MDLHTTRGKRKPTFPILPLMPLTQDLSYITGDLPGIGGRIKQRPEDFLVEETPLYEPSGEGEHLYLFIEKQELTTSDAIRRIAKAFRVSRREVGYAGLKDKHGVTRQHVSLHLPENDVAADRDSIERLRYHEPRLKLLWQARHGNKLRRGHHGGNRFVIYVRGVEPTAVLRVRSILERLDREGVPNYFGEQRFGYRANGHALGRHLLRGDYGAFLDELLGRPESNESESLQAARAAYDRGEIDKALEQWPRSLRFDRQALDALRQHCTPAEAVGMIDESHRHLLVSALQSAVFNRVVDRRIREGRFPQLIEGDLAWKHDSRAVFAADAEAVAEDNAVGGRVERLAVSPSGPMWGRGMTRAAGEADRLEVEALEAEGLAPEAMEVEREAPAITPGGSRRPMRVRLTDADVSGGVDEQGGFVRVAFELPRGAFATMAMREVMKNAEIHKA